MHYKQIIIAVFLLPCLSTCSNGSEDINPLSPDAVYERIGDGLSGSLDDYRRVYYEQHSINQDNNDLGLQVLRWYDGFEAGDWVRPRVKLSKLQKKNLNDCRADFETFFEAINVQNFAFDARDARTFAGIAANFVYVIYESDIDHMKKQTAAVLDIDRCEPLFIEPNEAMIDFKDQHGHLRVRALLVNNLHYTVFYSKSSNQVALLKFLLPERTVGEVTETEASDAGCTVEGAVHLYDRYSDTSSSCYKVSKALKLDTLTYEFLVISMNPLHLDERWEKLQRYQKRYGIRAVDYRTNSSYGKHSVAHSGTVYFSEGEALEIEPDQFSLIETYPKGF